MEDPLGMMWCPHCKDKTSNSYTSSNIVKCTACGKSKTGSYKSPYDLRRRNEKKKK